MAALLTDNQKAWVAELRSGNRRQTNGVLKRVEAGEESFCCLGVASEMSGLCVQSKTNHDRSYINVMFTPVGRESKYETFPPGEVLVWLGAADSGTTNGGDVVLDVPRKIELLEMQGARSDFDYYEVGNPRSELGGMTAANLNDDGFTFEMIADCIEYFGIKVR